MTTGSDGSSSTEGPLEVSILTAAKSVWEKGELAVLRRRQHDSLKLREIFAKRYDIHVGMQSYGCFDRWRMRGPMQVGRYCSIANTVRSALDNHPFEAMTTHPALYEKKFGVVASDRQWDGHLSISDDVWIGHNVVLLPGCKTIGRGAIIGAGAIVTRSVEPYAIIAGNPARKLRMRFGTELIAALEQSQCASNRSVGGHVTHI
jgi:acetyltransferase-like isoleucine patch superfamily enzyme